MVFIFAEAFRERGIRMTFLDFLVDDSADMVERGPILAAIVVVAVAIWFAIGNKLAARLQQVNAALG